MKILLDSNLLCILPFSFLVSFTHPLPSSFQKLARQKQNGNPYRTRAVIQVNKATKLKPS